MACHLQAAGHEAIMRLLVMQDNINMNLKTSQHYHMQPNMDMKQL